MQNIETTGINQLLASNWNQMVVKKFFWAISILFFLEVWVRQIYCMKSVGVCQQVEFSTLITFDTYQKVLLFGQRFISTLAKHFAQNLFKIKASRSGILLHHAKHAHVFVWLLCPNTFWEHTICLYIHFDYTPSFSITQFSLLSREQLNKMWKIGFVIVYTLHLHGCERVCLQGIIW